MMGVFPLADTMIRLSGTPWSRGDTPAGANGWANEVWWYPDPTTTSRRDAAAATSPTDILNPSDLTMRCSGTGREIRPGRPGTYRSAPAGPELATGNGLQ